MYSIIGGLERPADLRGFWETTWRPASIVANIVVTHSLYGCNMLYLNAYVKLNDIGVF